jgi:hypothetical protein
MISGGYAFYDLEVEKDRLEGRLEQEVKVLAANSAER